MAEPRPAPRGGADTAVPARQRRPQHDLHADRARSRRWATRAPIWMYDPAGRHHEQASVLRRRIVEEFRPLRAPVFKGFDDVARGGRGRGDRLGHRLPGDAAARVPGARLPDQRPRARVLRDLGGVALGGADLRARHVRDLGEPLAARPACTALRPARRLVPARRGPRHLPPAAGGAPARHHRLLRRSYTARRAVALGALALEELHRRRPELRVVVFGHEADEPLDAAVPVTSSSGSCLPSGWRGRTRRRPWGSACRSPTTRWYLRR